MEVTKLTTEVEQLRREKADLQGEMEAHKLTVRSGHVTLTNHIKKCVPLLRSHDLRCVNFAGLFGSCDLHIPLCDCLLLRLR